MSPIALDPSTAHGRFDDDLNLSILGFGVEYPPYSHGPGALEELANRFYEPSTA